MLEWGLNSENDFRKGSSRSALAKNVVFVSQLFSNKNLDTENDFRRVTSRSSPKTILNILVNWYLIEFSTTDSTVSVVIHGFPDRFRPCRLSSPSSKPEVTLLPSPDNTPPIHRSHIRLIHIKSGLVFLKQFFFLSSLFTTSPSFFSYYFFAGCQAELTS